MSKEKLMKPIYKRLLELYGSLIIIQHNLNLAREHPSYFDIPIAGQLRALLRPRGSRNIPLLFSLMDELGFKDDIYHMPLDSDAELKKILGSAVLSRVQSLLLSLEKTHPKQIQSNLRTFLEEPTVTVEGNSHTIGKIIDWIADKMGGAHYDLDIPYEVAFLQVLERQSGINATASIFLALAPLVLELGLRILQKQFCFGIGMSFSIVETNAHNEGLVLYAIESPLPEAGNQVHSKLLLYINRYSQLCMRLRDMRGSETVILLPLCLEQNTRYDLVISHHIFDTLESYVDISVNGKNHRIKLLPQVLIYLHENDICYFGYANEVRNKVMQPLHFKAQEYFIREGSPTYIQHGQAAGYLLGKEYGDTAAIVFGKNNYGTHLFRKGEDTKILPYNLS
jgi:hypothetical protein